MRCLRNSTSATSTSQDILRYQNMLQNCEKSLIPQLTQDLNETKEKILSATTQLKKIYDVKNYKNWCVTDIMFWIGSLENGIFENHTDVLEAAFTKDGITGKDLPNIDKHDLLRHGINVFEHRIMKTNQHHPSQRHQNLILILMILISMILLSF